MMQQKILNISFIWRNQQLNVELDSESTVKDLGLQLQKLTKAKPETIKLLVPLFKDSRLIAPFSDDCSSLNLHEASIVEGKTIRMMGAFDEEIVGVSQSSSKADLRIAGFDDEETRMMQRSSKGSRALLKLPKGPYIFCDFQPLHIPGLETSEMPWLSVRRQIHSSEQLFSLFFTH